jgi:4-hydroxy-2,2'-bipyrrole-5-carbaldehyde O-methyltransferase
MSRIVDEVRRRAPGIRGSLAMLRTARVTAQLALRHDATAFVRLHYLASASRAGIIDALPASQAELAERLEVSNADLLDGLVRLGLALGELSQEPDGRISLAGQRSLALVGEDGAPLVAMLEEFTGYHASVYRELPARIAGAPLGDYLGPTATVVANSSRVVEPFVASFVGTVVGRLRPRRLLEVGCGSGIYLRAAARAEPGLSGIGIDMDPEVVALASKNLRAWGLADSFRVLRADIRVPPNELAGPFDLVTLYNNVYYFAVDERPALFRKLRGWLGAEGGLSLVSMMQGGSTLAADLDLTLRSTVGATALPHLDQLQSQLHESGFDQVESFKLLATDPFYGVVAR